MRKIVALRNVVVGLLVMAAIGCTQPIYNVERHPVPVTARNLPEDRMRQAIIDAGVRYEWLMEQVGPQTLRATHKRNQHSATVDISYSGQDYSIRLQNSAAL